MPLVKLTSRIMQSNLQELSLPYRLTYAVTSRCQARCSMCNIWRKPHGNELSPAEIDTLFGRADRFSWINLTGGELFQRRDINDIFLIIIRRSRNLHLLNFPTNGFQTKEIVTAVDTILEQTDLPRLIVSVSMDGPPEVHDGIRGIPGCWDHAVQTFRQLKDRSSGRFSVYFGHTMQSANVGKFNATLDACRKSLATITVDDFHINLAHSSTHYYNNEDTGALPDPELAVAEIGRIRKLQSPKLFDPVAFIEQRYQRHIRDYLSSGRGPFVCQAAGASCFIDPTGTVYPCSVFNSPLGALRDFDMDFQRLWHSATRTDTRELIRNSQCPGCWTPCEAYQTLLANLIKGKHK
ncbi:MAG: radical SAM protein [Nitrospirae bacterium]|nr:MAG: radical SAM protein [Nitrospirota bacterium]